MKNSISITRQNGLKNLLLFKDKEVIKVITGVRRCGKSTLLEQFKNHLLENGTKESQIVYINFEDYENRLLLETDNFYAYIKASIIENKRMYLLFDEIQQVRDFQKVVDSFYIKKNIDIYLTGSNSNLLSGELTTLLTGRYVEIKMQPFSIREFMEAAKITSRQEAYRKYIETSSFPYTVQLLENPDAVKIYLEGVYNSIIVKDILNRKKINDIKILTSITQFVFDNIGLELSSKQIADTLTSNGRKIDSRTVENYISALTDTFIVYKAERYNIKGKEYLKSLEKYYICDLGLRNALLGKKAMDTGHILENIVYLELVRRGYAVYVGKIDSLEVDFVAQNEDGNLYIQVAASVRDEATLQRELKPLMAIRDSYKKIILTLDDDPEADYNGIKRMNAVDWLLEDGK
ncbi:MAG: ATP-binding protein [Treponema sp.]